MDETRIGVLLPEDAKKPEAHHVLCRASAGPRGVVGCGCDDLLKAAKAEPKKPGLWSKLGNAVGEAIGTWFAGRQ